MPRAAAARELPPPLELLCLNALWSLGEGSVRDVQQALSPHRTLAYTTVMTLLERMARKGLVSRQKAGRSFRYAPQIARDAIRRIALRGFLTTHFEGSAEQLRNFLDGRPDAAAQSDDAAAPGPETRLDTALL